MNIRFTTKNSITVAVIVSIVLYALYDYKDIRGLMAYDGRFSEVKGVVYQATYIGNKEIFGPNRMEVELDNGDSYILVYENKTPLIEKGDALILSLPMDQIFRDRGKLMTNKFELTKVDRIIFD